MNLRRTRRALTTLSPIRERMPRRKDNTFSFDDSFVLVLTSPPRLTVQVLDEKHTPRVRGKVLIKRIVVVACVAYNACAMFLRAYLKQ
jgi:hypothetical protein